MNYQKLLKDARVKAMELDKEDSVAVLLLEHITKTSASQLFAKMHEEVKASELEEFNYIFNNTTRYPFVLNDLLYFYFKRPLLNMKYLQQKL